MRSWPAGLLLIAVLGCTSDDGAGTTAAPPRSSELNPMIALQQRDQPVFGLYAPRARQRSPGGAEDPGPVKTAQQLAGETIAYERSDFVFVGSMEGGVERGLPAFTEFMSAMRDAGSTAETHPLVVKMQNIAEDPDAVAHIGQPLNAGVSAIVFVGVESVEELRLGLDAMRFGSNGGTRRDDVGWAPTYWDLTEEEYRKRADLWPLNPDGALVNHTIIESHEGLAHVREIAAVPGVGVLWPGAGTLRRLFSSTDADGRRQVDMEAWEAATQQVLSACQKFDVACGYPANADDIETRLTQGFSVFVMNWGENGFETVEKGRAATGR